MILKLDNSAQIFNTLSDIPGDVTDAEQLLEVCNYNTVVVFGDATKKRSVKHLLRCPGFIYP